MTIISQISAFENLSEFIPFVEEALSNGDNIYEISYILLAMSKVPSVFQALIQKRIVEKYLNFDVPESLVEKKNEFKTKYFNSLHE
jgi:hypothetical protein